MAISPDFNGRRLHLANSFREWRTAHEAAEDLGTETGSVYGLIKRMHGEGILEADSDPDPPTRGTQYRLKPEALIALDNALAQIGAKRQEPGRLEQDQRLIIARGGAQLDLERTLADPSLSLEVAWVAWVGASWIVALDPDAEPQLLRRLIGSLESGGFECERSRVDELTDASRFRAQSRSNVERIGASR